MRNPIRFFTVALAILTATLALCGCIIHHGPF